MTKKNPGGHRGGPAPELLYGRQAVRESLRANRRHFTALFLTKGGKPNPVVEEISETARTRGLRLEVVERRELDESLEGSNHQGVALAAGSYPYVELDQTLALARARHQDPLLLCLDQVQDPQNLGTLLRTAEACGVHGIVLPRHRAAAITPAVVNASAGAVEHLLVCQVTNLSTSMKSLKESGLWFAGLEARPDALSFDAIDLNGPLGIVVGSEGHGLGRLVAETCDWLVELPMAGRINSLNAAVAGSIMLYHVTRLRAMDSNQ